RGARLRLRAHGAQQGPAGAVGGAPHRRQRPARSAAAGCARAGRAAHRHHRGGAGVRPGRPGAHHPWLDRGARLPRGAGGDDPGGDRLRARQLARRPAAAGRRPAAEGALVKRVRLGLLLFLLVAGSALLAPWLVRHDPLEPDYRARYAAPSGEHLLGTDGLGRDVLSRSLAGGRVSLLIALSATGLTLLLGGLLGLLAAGVGGLTDTALSRLFDALLAFPGFLLILLVVAILGGGAAQTVLAMGVAGSPVYFRLTRGFTRSELRRE